MQMILIDLSKYVFAFLLIIYSAVAYYGATLMNEKIRKKLYIIQNGLMLLIHLLGYIIIYVLNDSKIDYIILYIEQFIFLLVVIAAYDILYPKASRILINNMCMLMVIGYIILGRLNVSKCQKQFVIAVISVIVTFFIPWVFKTVKIFKDLAWLYFISGVCLMGALLLGSRTKGANIAIKLGPITIQPTEFVKILFVLFVAAMLNKAKTIKDYLITCALSAVYILVLVAAKDLGPALIFCIAFLMMIYIASRRVWVMFGGIGLGCLSSIIAYKLFAHIRVRFEIWKNPWPTIDSGSYQTCQSLFAIGSGMWFGSGIGQGMPDKIPLVEKDFIFAAIVEEFGAVFAIALIFICLNNFILMMKIASRCKVMFYRLIAVGLGVQYGFQIFMTIGGAMNLIPMTGVTLPFVSYGGSSVMSSVVLFAIINGLYNMRQDEVSYNE